MGKWRKDGTRSGYTEYRFGTVKKPVTLPKIFTGQARSAMLGIVAEHMDSWSLSAFQKEGATVASIRSSLCLKGHPFQNSEHEAFAIVGEALRRNGARRPSWDEGQVEYTRRDECCVRCGGGLPADASIGLRNRVLCSVACARSYFHIREDDRRLQDDRVKMQAYRMLKAVECTPRDCPQCEKPFHPKFESSEQIYCSRVCRAQAKRTVLTRDCAGCGDAFRPTQKSDSSVYCSRDCRAGKVTARYSLCCELCGVGFEAKVRFAKYCSAAHRNEASRANKTRKEDNVIYLTAELFDEMYGRLRQARQNKTASEALDRLFG